MTDLDNDRDNHEQNHNSSQDSFARREFLKQTTVATMILGVGIPTAQAATEGPTEAVNLTPSGGPLTQDLAAAKKRSIAVSSMQPVPIGDRFKQGNQVTRPGQQAPDFDFTAMEGRTDIALIMTVETNGKVTIYNHPQTAADKLKSSDHLHPYPTGALYDTCVITMAIYADATDPTILRLGAWSPGPPLRCYT